jgi:ABC-type cobalamin/Fe3+-siderophores transport system ATPase subunit
MREPLLALERVSKCYRHGSTHRRVVLEDVSFSVAAGEIVAVDAERRAGKTTLLQVVAGIEAEDSGTVYVGGEALTAKARRRLLGAGIGWADRRGPQNPWKVLDYVALPLSVGGGPRALKRARDSALAALERVGAEHCAAARQWDELADYEQVLVSLARLYAQRPRLIVADDLFDDLRVRGCVEAGDLLSSIVRELGCGVLASVSDTEAALLADRVFALRKGEIVVRSDQTPRPDLRLVRASGSAGANAG